MGLLIGALLGIAVILAIEYIDDTIKVPEDVETKLKVSVLGVIPKLTRDTTLIEELSISRSKISEAYFTARTSLQFSSPRRHAARAAGDEHQAFPEGKSSSAPRPAQSFAKVGLKVLLIDADMRKPSFTAKEGDGTGLSALLAGGNLSEPKILSTNITNLHLLPSGPIPPNPAELLASANLPRLLAIMRERFDLIVVDGPPILGLADAPAARRGLRRYRGDHRIRRDPPAGGTELDQASARRWRSGDGRGADQVQSEVRRVRLWLRLRLWLQLRLWRR